MRIRLFVSLLSALLVTSQLTLQAQTPQSNPSAAGAAPFLGRWDLTLRTPEHEYGSWLEITANSSGLTGRMVGRWGHAHPVLRLQVQNGVLSFASPKQEEGLSEDLAFQGRLADGKLAGSINGPNGITWTWSGERAPDLRRSSAPQWGKAVSLFDGKDTQGWFFADPKNAGNWSVKDGVLTTSRRGSDLITDRKFKDFKLHVEFNCVAKCNSGVYLRGRYEVQVADAGERVNPKQRLGAIYGYIAPSPAISITPGEWQSYDITLIGRMVTVVYNGSTIIDNQEIPGVTGGALDSHEGQPGPIYLQGSEDAAPASFRNIVIIPAID